MRRPNPLILSGAVLGIAALASGDPIPVVGVAIGTRAPARERLAAVATALGADALAGAALVSALGTSIGEAPPIGDPLGPLRATADRLVRQPRDVF